MFGAKKQKPSTLGSAGAISAPVTFSMMPDLGQAGLDGDNASSTAAKAAGTASSTPGTASRFEASFKASPAWVPSGTANGDGNGGASASDSGHHESDQPHSSSRLLSSHAGRTMSFRAVRSPDVQAGGVNDGSAGTDGAVATLVSKTSFSSKTSLKTSTAAVPSAETPEALGGTSGMASADTTQSPVPVARFAAASVAGTESAEASPAPLTAAAAAPALNKIALENLKEGNPESEWGITGDGDANIQGFATNISTNVGGTVDFKIATDSTHYRIDIYRLGYYGGDGARKVGSIDKSLTTAQIQPHPIVDMDKGLIDCGNWSVSASWTIPSDAVSGVYFAKLVREDGTKGESIVPFVVREDGSKSDIVFQTSDTTWQAYNEWGGASLYFGEVPTDPNDMIAYMPPNCSCGIKAIGRAYEVSYNRPIVTSTSNKGGPHDFIFGAEHSAIRWLEQNGYDVSYISGVDTSRSGSSLLDHKAFLSVGHDEYWSGEQRQAVEAARNAGVNLAFWGGNDCYWKIRWENSIDGNGTPYRTMVCYKETWANADIDEGGATGTWRDPRYADPGQKPENALIGTMFQVDSYREDQITVPYDYSQLRFWRNTDIAQLQPGETGTLAKNLLGYEWNSDVDNGFRPAGLVNLSLTNVSVQQYVFDYGSTVGAADAQHSLTMYRDQNSGALVFSAGTVFWSWGLDSNHTGAATPTDPNVQQAMVNMFADMGIQPTSLVASLIAAKSTEDFVKPTSTITSPIVGEAHTEGQRIVITGTAADGGGGRVAGIEVSVDGGLTWRKATGTTSWTYAWNAQAAGAYVIKARATDDSLNMETPSAGTTITVSLPDTNSLWTYAAKPAQETTVERKPVELGVRFTSSATGYVSAIRFYKGQYNIGDHTVNLWTADGQLIASNVSVSETATGWQTVKLIQPIRIQAGITYVASYHTNGFYSASTGYFNSTYTNGPLSVGAGGGVYKYGDTSTAVPDQVYLNENYWVDVVFKPGAAPVNGTPNAHDDSGFSTSGNTSLSIAAAQLLANDNDPDGDPLSIVSVAGAVNGTVAFNSQTNAVTFTPTNNFSGTASFSYTISDGLGGASTAKVSLQVGAPMPQSLFSSSSAPTVQNSGDNGAVELGMKFVAASNGTVSAIRFYKGSANTGAHTGSLWSSTGERLGTVTFTNESASGWQMATLATPIAINAGATYTVSYYTSSGYSYTDNQFANSIVNGQLTAPSSASSGGNGVFRYGSGGVAPTQSYGNTNYWVDVVFNPGATVANRVPVAANDTGFSTNRDTALSLGAAALLANDNDPDGDALSITGVSAAVNGTVSYDAQTKTITFTPTAGYTGAAGFSYAVSDGRGGAASANVALTVTSPTPTNRAPVATNDSGFSTTKNTALTLAASSLLANDTDADGDTLSITGVSAATNGTVSFNSQTGQVTFTPTTGYAGAAGFTYAISDGKGGTATASVAVTVTDPTPANRAPVANNDSGFSTTRNTALSLAASALLANDTDADGDALTITGVSAATNGTVAFNSQTGQITFTPATGYSGTAGFSYAIADGKGGTATASVALTVTDPAATQSLFAASATPAVQNSGDSGAVELGMKFSASVDGTITGVRFFKGSANSGTHTGTLWSASGQRMGTVTFTDETASGWQTATFSAPVAITAGASYTVSYYTSSGYSYTSNGFSSAVSNGSLTAPVGAGVFRYGTGNVAPTQSFQNTNYWVDVLFNPGGTAPNRSPVATADAGFSVAKNTALTFNASALLANDSDPDGDTLAVTGVSGATKGTVSFDAQNKTVTFTPTADYTGAASFSYAISDGKGGTASSNVALNVQDPAATQSIFAGTDTPTTVRVNDSKPVELGMKFKADVAGTITAIRFYKGSDNTGPHEGHLWNASNQLVGTATFTNETASGWQEAALDTPVNIAAGDVYTVSYHTNGYYSATSNGFATNKVSGNLEALVGSVTGGNGVYKYGASGTFPNESFNKTNYYVDVVFKPQLAA